MKTCDKTFARTLRVHRRTVERQWELAQADTLAVSAPVADDHFDLLTDVVDSDDDRAALSEDALQAEEELQVGSFCISPLMRRTA